MFLQSSLQVAWSQLTAKLLNFLPLLLGATVLMLIGLILSDWIKKLVEEFLKIAHLPQLFQKLGINKFLKQADISQTPTQITGQLAKWFIILIFFMASANLLGLTAISRILDRLLLFIPNVLVASLILAAGLLIANFTENLTKGLLANFDKQLQHPLSQLAKYLVVVFFTLAAISQLHIAEKLITTFFQGLTWTITLAVGLSVGLGSKDLVAKLLDQWYKNLQKK